LIQFKGLVDMSSFYHKRKSKTKYIIIVVLLLVVALMLFSFSANQQLTEIVLFP